MTNKFSDSENLQTLSQYYFLLGATLESKGRQVRVKDVHVHSGPPRMLSINNGEKLLSFAVALRIKPSISARNYADFDRLGVNFHGE